MKSEQTAESVATYYLSNLARYGATMFTGMLVAVTFLLLAGLRNPKMPLLVFMYIALASFAVSILVYLLHSFFKIRLLQQTAVSDSSSKDDDKGKKAAKDRAGLVKMIKVLQVIQQIVFAIGLITVAGFAIEVAALFFAASAAQSAPTGQ